MEWNMPIMSGFNALKAIRAMGKTVPIVMVTSEAEKSQVIQALKAGANDYIINPFEPHSAIKKIKQILS
jgi:two-component system chemotaxis response regulator CheY